MEWSNPSQIRFVSIRWVCCTPFGVPVLYAFAVYSHTPVFTAVKDVQAEIRDRR